MNLGRHTNIHHSKRGEVLALAALGSGPGFFVTFSFCLFLTPLLCTFIYRISLLRKKKRFFSLAKDPKVGVQCSPRDLTTAGLSFPHVPLITGSN